MKRLWQMEPAGRVQNTSVGGKFPPAAPQPPKLCLTLVKEGRATYLERFREGRAVGKSTTPGVEKSMLIFHSWPSDVSLW